MDSYPELHGLDSGAIVEDHDGEVWLVTKHRDQTWLCPFSDEYAFAVKNDGTTYALGHTPPLPIKELAHVFVDEVSSADDQTQASQPPS